MAGQRDRFLRDAFHQVAVGNQHVGMMIDGFLAELRAEHFLGQRHADRGGNALAERACRGLDAFGVEILRMSRRQRSQLTELLDLVERHVVVAGEIQQRIQQHRAVAGREHEAVAVRPVRLGSVEFQELREQHGGDVGRAHRQAGMAGIGLLHGIHGEPADRIGHTGMIDARHDENPSEMRCLVAIRIVRERLGGSLVARGGQGWIASVFVESKVKGQTNRDNRRDAEKLLCSA